MKAYSLFFAVACALSLSACHSRKLIQKSQPVAVAQPAPVPPPPAPKPAPVVTPPPPAPDYHFNNIQFDFNSAVLRTDAIQYLDHITTEMKKDQSAKFILNGYASAEGTAKHNLQLSKDRAASVKQYLVNAGIDANRLAPHGYGETHPVATNKTEAGREKNRRVEVKLLF